jgi:hypothetical protein
MGDLEEARRYFLRSHELMHLHGQNEFAKTYLEIVERRIAERAATQ